MNKSLTFFKILKNALQFLKLKYARLFSDKKSNYAAWDLLHLAYFEFEPSDWNVSKILHNLTEMLDSVKDNYEIYLFYI